MPSPRSPARVLAIAGSDSGGGAGIQADLKAMAASGVHGMTAITAVTAQSTLGVASIHPVPPETIIDQVRVVAEDIGVDAVKVGMLGTVAAIDAVAFALELVGGAPVVIDPVMVAESGAVLLEEDARAALRERLLPRAAVVTPNLQEARVLVDSASGEERHDGEDAEALARAVLALGPGVVVVTGGHRRAAADLYLDRERLVSIPGERHPDGAAHGSGCTHSSTLAAQLALGATPLEAAHAAREAAAAAVRDGLRGLGAGAGPVDVLGLGRRSGL